MIGHLNLEVMLDSGSSISLLAQANVEQMTNITEKPVPTILLRTASGIPLPIVKYVTASVLIQNMETTLQHDFFVVSDLIVPAILGLDFLQQHGLVLDFSSNAVQVYPKVKHTDVKCQELRQIVEEARNNKPHVGIIAAINDDSSELTEDCAIPKFGTSKAYELPENCGDEFRQLIEEHKDLFCTTPGKTTCDCHYIPTKGPPIRVPPRRIPGHYREEVARQIEQMLSQGIIKESSSPWMAPTVFVPKKSGELRICVDYRALNKQSVRDSYPLPLPDEIQDHLTNATVFSTLDLHSGYWQLPVAETDQPKTAFCPGPGMGLYQFCRMPFGLSGAPASFQRLMDSVLRGLPFASTYLDDILVYSPNIESHKDHLHQVFLCLHKAGLTLRGRKCCIGVPKVCYLGHIFSASGIQPDPSKVHAVQAWPTPVDVTTLRQFLGLASYYRRYVQNFADIAAPLHALTQKGVPFHWTTAHDDAFSHLKSVLTQAPILTYPDFSTTAPTFLLQTDASDVGLGAVLEQGGHVIAYASRALTKSESNYSAIQKECLAVVFGMKQFRHYLLGRSFTLMTDHAPLQWLSAQKMQGLLSRWALAMQEYTFEIVYRKGTENINADSLSRNPIPISHSVVATSSQLITTDTQCAQLNDSVIKQIYDALSTSSIKPTDGKWTQPLLRRYLQIWHQLSLTDGVVCRTYKPGPSQHLVTVPLLPASLHKSALYQSHDIAASGHQGISKTLRRLQEVAYWVGMARDVSQYCVQCVVCQQAKLPAPTPAPLTNIPIGGPWQMLAADILEVPVSRHQNKYLLVVMDYFTKWAEAVPLRDQTAASISAAVIKICCSFGVPDVLHSDQGRNFESHLFHQVLSAFGIQKSHTTAYHPQGDGMVERFNRSLLQLLRCYTDTEDDWEEFLPMIMYAYRTAKHSSTNLSPFELMFGRSPCTIPFQSLNKFDTTSYASYLKAKLHTMQDFVHTNLAKSAKQQKQQYDRYTVSRSFKTGDPVWLSIPTARKLQPRWDGRWVVTKLKGPCNLEITNGHQSKVVHVNRVQRRIQPNQNLDPSVPTKLQQWNSPDIDHHFVSPDSENNDTPQRRYPLRERHPPDWLCF